MNTPDRAPSYPMEDCDKWTGRTVVRNGTAETGIVQHAERQPDGTVELWISTAEHSRLQRRTVRSTNDYWTIVHADPRSGSLTR